MKTTTLFSLFLLSTFLSDLASTTSIVLDFEGEPLVNGGTYYMLPTIWAKGGGIELVATGKETCPLNIVLSPYEFNEGQPIRVSSFVRSKFVLDGFQVRIGFAYPPQCAPSQWWTIAEGLPEGPAVKLSDDYESTQDGWFKIEKVSSTMNSYKLLFCAQEDSECGHIGIYWDEEGNRRLVVTKDNQLEVGFKKARSSSSDA